MRLQPTENTANETTELVFILDRSGSMCGLEDDTIGGYNSTLEKQRELPGKALVTTVLFNDEVQVTGDRVNLADAAPMTRGQYQVFGCTALLDAVGSTIKRINKQQKADPAGRPDHTVFVITTDGLENASRTFTLEKVRKLIEKRTEKNGWEFLFLGANMDAIETAGSMGIHADRAASYVCDEQGTETIYAAMDEAIAGVRCCGSVPCAWKADVEMDYASRG